jgi:hypothetical protein
MTRKEDSCKTRWDYIAIYRDLIIYEILQSRSKKYKFKILI